MLVKRIFIVAIILFLAWQWSLHRDSIPAPAAPSATIASSSTNDKSAPNTPPISNEAAPANDNNADLPPEAQTTLRLIASNGPFPFDRDGVVFGNFEHPLPQQARGYYHEYTVPTPGASNRGARRISADGDPPRVFSYPGDHYESFQRIEVKP